MGGFLWTVNDSVVTEQALHRGLRGEEGNLSSRAVELCIEAVFFRSCATLFIDTVTHVSEASERVTRLMC